jgi:hypothetical protein
LEQNGYCFWDKKSCLKAKLGFIKVHFYSVISHFQA